MRNAIIASCLGVALAQSAVHGELRDDVGKADYSVGQWEEKFGLHRARVRVRQQADAVLCRIPWRRRDRDPQTKRVLVVDATTGNELKNIICPVLKREYGDVIFQPATVPGEYFIYYLPFQVVEGYGFYGGDYLPPQVTAEPDWLDRNKLAFDQLAGGRVPALPAAELIDLQARTQFDRLDPMEVVATQAEVQSLQSRYPAPFLLFPEDRKYPIRMTEDLPLRWVEAGPRTTMSCEARRHEYFAFQIGVFAARQDLRNLSVECQSLRSDDGAVITADKITCFNLSGTDWLGQPFKKQVSVAKGRVQALWFGIDVPRTAAPGNYTGAVTIRPTGAKPQTVTVELKVSEEVAEDRGDNDLWRHARLRWLNSTKAIDHEVVSPFRPLRVEGNTVHCLTRSVQFDTTGLPATIRSGEREILAEPVRLVVEADGPHRFAVKEAVRLNREAEGLVSSTTSGSAGPLDVQCTTSMEADGWIRFVVQLNAKEAAALEDLRLEIPVRRDIAKYLMGMGRDGGNRPSEWSWEWPTKPQEFQWRGLPYQDSFWIGDFDAGLHCELRGASYCGPMVNLYWRLGQLDPPTTWSNNGKGGCTLREIGEDQVLITAYGGPRELAAAEQIRFEFAFLITPVKPLDPARHFRERYYHACVPVEQAKQAGGNILNIHHASEPNPYINYPFLAADKLKDYTQLAHRRGVKVKIYYTVRELTNHVVELFAFRSLGHEILAPGADSHAFGTGYPWLREHLVTDYTPAWYQHFPDGDVCAALVNSGASRFYNYHVEGLEWLVRNCEIDGLYLDDVSYDRETLKRIRKVMARTRPGCLIDLHSNTAFSRGPANQYAEFFPYIDRIWFGEGFDYDLPPDFWLTEISGIPFGLMGDMLEGGGNAWRGMLYGMTARIPWHTPRNHVWELWDSFGIDRATMLGYWNPKCPVRTDHEDTLATVYVRDGKALLAVATWAQRPTQCHLAIDWEALGIDRRQARLYAPPIQDFQQEASFGPDDAIPILPGRGWLLLVDTQQRDVARFDVRVDSGRKGRRLLWDESFEDADLRAQWRTVTSPKPGTRLLAREGALQIESLAHSAAFVQRDLPPGVTMVECAINTGKDGGMTWGPGLGIVFSNAFLRINLRTTEGRIGIDDGTRQWFHRCGIESDTDYSIRIRLEQPRAHLEMSVDGRIWWELQSFARQQFAGDPVTVKVGKMAGDGSNTDADDPPNPKGRCGVQSVRVYTSG